MHESSYKQAEQFAAKYLDPAAPLRICDVGSYDVNGTLQPIFSRWNYIGCDVRPGPNVALLLADPYRWPEIGTNVFDVVVAAQVLLHVPAPWRWIREIARICRKGGLIYLCSPVSWGHSPHPVDCWRVGPDGMLALLEEANLTPVEIFVSGQDTVGIARKEP